MDVHDDKSIVLNYELMPWFQFKLIMYDIYDHRIKYSPELGGTCNSNYCTLNESLLMFFVEKCDSRE